MKRNRRSITQDAIDTLGDLRGDGVQLFARQLGLGGNDFVTWSTDRVIWQRKVENHLETAFSRADKRRFENIGPIDWPPHTGFLHQHAVSRTHDNDLMCLTKQLATLENILDRHAAALANAVGVKLSGPTDGP